MSEFLDIIRSEDPVKALNEMPSYRVIDLLRIHRDDLTLKELIKLKEHCVIHLSRCKRTIEAIKLMYNSLLIQIVSNQIDDAIKIWLMVMI